MLTNSGSDTDSRRLTVSMMQRNGDSTSRWCRECAIRVSSKETKIIFGSNRNIPKQDLFRVCFGFVSVCFVKPKTKNFGLFRCFEPISKQLKIKQNCFETNRNIPKFSEKCQNMLSIKQFRLVFCLFRFNQNIITRCFGIEPKQPTQTVSKQTKTNRNNPKFCEKNTKICSLSHRLGCSSVCFGNRNTETLCFGIEPKQMCCFG